MDRTLEQAEDRLKVPALFTIGFTRTTARAFFERLVTAKVRALIDVRLNNTSQLSAFAKKDDLAYFCEVIAGARYVHAPSCAPTQAMLSAYQAKALPWPAYAQAFEALMDERRPEEALPLELLDHGCLLCSEAAPHHCHRRLVAERLARVHGGLEIIHL